MSGAHKDHQAPLDVRQTQGRLSLTRWPQQGLIALVQAYRFLLKPWLGQACRFEPTCSQYALTALQRHGAVVGAALTTGRLMRCHPWCAGGCDDVPNQAPRWFRRLGLGDVSPSRSPASPSAPLPCEPNPSKPSP